MSLAVHRQHSSSDHDHQRPARQVLLRGVGTALPQHCVGQREAAEISKTFVYGSPEQTRLFPALYRKAQVRKRNFALIESSGDDGIRQSFYPPASADDDHGPTTAQRMERYTPLASSLAEVAARRALEQAAIDTDEITHLVTVSCTGFAAPGVDVALMVSLGLRPTVQRVHVGFMGCHGAINGLRVARGLVGADPHVRVLLCAVELCGLHFQYGVDPNHLVANSLFSDGAAAAVLASSDGGRSETPWRLAATGSCLMPDSQDVMTWRIGNNGFQMTLSPRVPELISQHLRPWLEDWLGQHGLKLADVASWAVHPGGPRIVSSVVEALGLSDTSTQVSREVLAECGNMSSPTVLFVVERLQQRGAKPPCVMLGFGPGLIAEAALLL